MVFKKTNNFGEKENSRQDQRDTTLTFDNILEKFNLKDNILKEYKYWYLMLRYNQVKLGSCVIMLKRAAFPISEVTSEEMSEYAIVSKDIEYALKQTFKPF